MEVVKKAYDLRELGKHLKEQGLDLAEDAAKSVAKASIAWLKESSELSSTPYDNMILAVALPEIEKVVDKQLDKIDGKEG